MINEELCILKDKLVASIVSKENIQVKNQAMGEHEIRLNLKPEFLYVIISEEDITVFYEDEHEEFWKETYGSEIEWIQKATDFIIKLASNRISIEYFYDKRSNELLYYKIWCESSNGHRDLIKRVFVKTSPLILFKSKMVETKELV